MALGRGGDFESGCQVVAAAVGRNNRETGAAGAVLEPRPEPGKEARLRLRGGDTGAEAGEDLQPAGGAVEEILIGAEVRMDVGIQMAGTAPTSTPRKPAAATPTTVMG